MQVVRFGKEEEEDYVDSYDVYEDSERVYCYEDSGRLVCMLHYCNKYFWGDMALSNQEENVGIKGGFDNFMDALQACHNYKVMIFRDIPEAYKYLKTII